MARNPSIRDRMRYGFDNYMAKGGQSAFFGLMAVFGAFLFSMLLLRLVLVALFPAGAYQSHQGSFRNAVQAFIQVFGLSIESDLDSNVGIVFAALLAGIGGVFMVALLIAFLTSAFDTRLSRLRRGQSRVIEDGHTLVLGWEEQRVAEIVRELAFASQKSRRRVAGRRRRRAVVILADRDKQYMDDFLATQYMDDVLARALPRKPPIRVVTRSGKPASEVNLRLVSAGTARAAILLAGCTEAASNRQKAESDAKVVKTLLALADEQSPRGADASSSEGDPCPDVQQKSASINVVVELFRPASRSMCTTIPLKPISALDITSLLARILVQTSRTVGLSVVYDEIISFEGSELYLIKNEWAGRRFGQLCFTSEDWIPIGIVPAKGSVMLNPKTSVPVGNDARLLVLAKDAPSNCLPITAGDGLIQEGDDVYDQGRVRRGRALEKQLVIGWGTKGQRVLLEFASYVAEGSPLDVIPRSALSTVPSSDTLDLTTLHVDPLDPQTWVGLNPLDYDHIVLIAEIVDGSSADAVDAETIMILHLIREEIDNRDPKELLPRPTVVTELVDSVNQILAARSGVQDFVISSRVVSRLFAQIAEEPAMHKVFDQLFSAGGAEIYVKPVSLYASLPRTYTFGELRRRAMNRSPSETCIGVKYGDEKGHPRLRHGVDLIPADDSRMRFKKGDQLIVLAKDSF